jgi:hypothetical protein
MTRIDLQKYEGLFHRNVVKDFRLLIVVMKLLGWVNKEESAIMLTEKGSRWAHRFQMLFSLTFIDDVWTQCQGEPWPKEIILS